jgi:hypothetical protein
MDLKVMMDWAKVCEKKFDADHCDNYAAFMSDERNRTLMDLAVDALNRRDGHPDVPPLAYAVRLVSTLQWCRHGFNVFDVTDSLLAGLLLTTPSDEAGFPLFPYPSFVVRIPPGYVPMMEVGREVEPEAGWLTQITVNHFEEVQAGTGEALLLTVSTGRRGDDLVEQIRLNDYVSTADHLRADEARWKVLESGGTDPSQEAIDNLAVRAAIRIVANLCSWIESIGGMAGRRPSNALLARNGSPKKPHIRQWVVGREIKLDPELLRSAKEHILGLDPRRSPAGWHLKARFPVRGHMRRQPCGPGRAERRVIWIRPHFHGPAGGDVMAHIYSAGARDR